MSVLQRFLASGEPTHDNWRDGAEYDLALIGSMSGAERLEAERHLLSKPLPEFHEMRAIAALGSPRCVEHLRWFVSKGSPIQKLNATSCLEDFGHGGDMTATLREILPRALEGGDHLFSRILDQIGWSEHREAIPALMRVVEHGPGNRASLAGALILSLCGKAEDRLAMEHRPLWLKLNTPDPDDRAESIAALKRLAGTPLADALSKDGG